MRELAARFMLIWLIPLTVAVLMGLHGCAVAPAPAGPVRPDPALLQPCLDPEGSDETNGLLAQWFLAYRKALAECNNQITTFKETTHGQKQQP